LVNGSMSRDAMKNHRRGEKRVAGDPGWVMPWIDPETRRDMLLRLGVGTFP